MNFILLQFKEQVVLLSLQLGKKQHTLPQLKLGPTIYAIGPLVAQRYGDVI